MKNYLVCMAVCMCFQVAAQDWPNLQRFQKANAELSSVDKPSDRVVFMGNSITEFWRAGFFKENPSFVNRGISGQTTPQMLLRFRQDVIDLDPEAVVILAGINDIAHNTGPSTIDMIANNIFSMAELAIMNDIPVILCSVLPANDFPWRKEIKPADKVIALNALIQDYASEHQIRYVDYYSKMVDDKKGLPPHLGGDGVHPNKTGYAIMERLVLKAIDLTLNKNEALPDPLRAGWKGKDVCKVLNEDSKQRILKCTFPPNVGHEKHFHAPHVGYTIKGGKFRITDESGTKEIEVPDGTTWQKDGRSVHQVQNIGNTTSVYLIIEPKD